MWPWPLQDSIFFMVDTCAKFYKTRLASSVFILYTRNVAHILTNEQNHSSITIPPPWLVGCIHGKFQKFKRGRSPSFHLGKEGDFAQNHFKTLYFCTWWTLSWLSNAFSLENSIQFLLLKEKIMVKGEAQRGSFPLLGGRWMFSREMGLKRGRLDMYVVVLRIYVASAVFQSYRNLEAISENSSGKTGNRTLDLLLRKPRA